MVIKPERVFLELPIPPGAAWDGIDADFWRGLGSRCRTALAWQRDWGFADRTAGCRIARLDNCRRTMYIRPQGNPRGGK